MKPLPYRYDDAGRSDRKSSTRDCVTRAVAIAAELPYEQVWKEIAAGNATQRRTRSTVRISGVETADLGVHTTRKWFRDYMAGLGFSWTPTMAIGQGTTVHLRQGELPTGRLVVHVSRHSLAVIDGVMHDTHDPSRDGTRCVYGYWRLPQKAGAL
jgi:hypothetical protein